MELYSEWLSASEADALFDTLLREVPWRSRSLRIFGREVLEPRLVAWLGEPEAVYTYSGVRNVPEPLPPALLALRERLERELGLGFNGVLCNLYRDGRDAMGLHRDAEPELGPDPVVASLSLGASRRFQLRHRHVARGRLDLVLAHGTLLVMRGTTQRFYRHGVPREARVSEPRINLTFRRVFAGQARGGA